jgi:hypothetical protein
MSNKIHQYYRNKTALLTSDDVEIDPGALWKCEGDELILVDDDQYITAKLDFTLFEIEA